MYNPIKHHYVPECYLKPFTNYQKQFWSRSKTNNKPFLRFPSQVCFEKDGYKIREQETLIFSGITDKYHIEKHSFKKQENNYGRTLSKIVKYTSDISVIEKHKYKLFLETLLTIKRRNPSTRDFLIKNFANSIESTNAIDELRKFLNELKESSGMALNIETYIEDYIRV